MIFHVEAKVQHQAIDQHGQNTCRQTADGSLHGLMGGEHRRQLPLAEEPAGEIGPGVGDKGDHNGNQHQMTARIQQQDPCDGA